MATTNNLFSFKDAATRIGTLPTLNPRTKETNIKALNKDLINALQGVPSLAEWLVPSPSGPHPMVRTLATAQHHFTVASERKESHLIFLAFLHFDRAY